MHSHLKRLKQPLGFFHRFLMVIFLIIYCWSGFQVKETRNDKTLLLHASNSVEIVVHDAKLGAFQLQLNSKSFYHDYDLFKATSRITFYKSNSSQTLFVSFIERNVFYVFTSINAPWFYLKIEGQFYSGPISLFMQSFSEVENYRSHHLYLFKKFKFIY